jgi:thiamine biosynthesis lipoprotein
MQRECESAAVSCAPTKEGWGTLQQSRVLLALLLGMIALVTGCEKKHEVVAKGNTMGTTWRVVYVKKREVAEKDVSVLIQERLDALEKIFSNWQADTAVARFNISRSSEWQPVPKELSEVVVFAQELSTQTQGAFDVTAAALIDLWGFGARGRVSVPPTDAAIAKAKRDWGWEKLEVKTEPSMLRKALPDLRINVSALVEGYAVDDLVKRLRGKGIENFLVEVGGEIFASGVRADGLQWHVGVQRPDAEKGIVVGAMPLQDKALATSGTYQQFFEHEGKRYAHVLDARTGKPVEHSTTSVSVSAPTCVSADGWATALLILGPQEGAKLAEKHGVSAIFLTEQPAVR